MGRNAEIVQRGWEAVGRGDWDALVADYTENMRFIMPSQTDVLEGQSNFRKALEGLGDILPPGFDITSMRHIESNDEVVTILEWKSSKVPGGTQSAVLFKIAGDKVYEERWFVDTVQWKGAF
jgi:ketosteroid isomerase-like protein